MASDPGRDLSEAGEALSPSGSPSSLGDLVRAVRALGEPDAETLRAVARLLGLSIILPGDQVPAKGPGDGLEPDPGGPADGLSRDSPSEEERSGGRPTESEPPNEPDPGVLEFDVEHRVLVPRSRGAPDGGSATPRREPTPPFPHEPLFDATWVRGIIVALLATPREGHEPDIDRAIDLLARLSGLERIPLRPELTLARGCRILVDIGVGMAPFARDRSGLVRLVRSIGGDDLVEVLYFEECPTLGVWAKLGEPHGDFLPATAGTPVVVISDFGIAGPEFAVRRASGSDWLEFVARVREVGCPLVALTPYPPTRWPRPLAEALVMVAWDRGTTAASVRRARRDGGDLA